MTRVSKVQFAKAYVEMVLVMFAGMLVLGGALLLIVAALGTSPESSRRTPPPCSCSAWGSR